ncbi:MAG: TylF/MycF/NovP-related O-methyltransferase [Rhodothermales bacterium]
MLRPLRKAVDYARTFGFPAEVRQTMQAVRSRRLTYLSQRKLNALAEQILRIEKSRIPGAILEAGCAMGGSAILFASAKSPTRPLRVYDVFGMIPPPSEADGQDVHERYEVIKEGKAKGLGGDVYYGYRDDLYDAVHASFGALGYPPAPNRIELIKGLVQDTLVVDGPVALAHIDVDWYDPVMTCLERITPHLALGGALILDDYQDWSGCRKATDDYFAGQDRSRFVFDTSPGSLVVTRVG